MKAQLALLAMFVLVFCSCGEEATAAGSSIPHPDDPSKRVEYFVGSPQGNGPWPTIVLLHGHQDGPRPGGRDFVEWGVLEELAGRGYLAVAVSQPGYGNSSGPPDYSGPFTQHAVSAVIAKLRADGSASPRELLLLGISRGALTAGLLAANDPPVSGVVLISGVYDLPEYVEGAGASRTKALIVRSMKSETGGAPEALNARSVLEVSDRIAASALILSGAKDDRTDPDQARRLADRIVGRGGHARAIIYPEFGHMIPVDVRNRDVDPFIDSIFGRAGSP